MSLLAALDSIGPLPIVAVFLLCVLVLARFVPLQQNADGILPTIISLQKLTVYFWAQDRFGNLAPLLAAWILSPIRNLYAQVYFRLIAGLVAPLFFSALAFRRPADAWRATLLSDALLLVVGSTGVIHELFVEANPYGTSLACAGLAAIALGAPSRGFVGTLLKLAGAGGLLVAYVVNFGLVIVALPLMGLFAIFLPSVITMRLLVLHALAAVVGYLLPAILVPDFHSSLMLAPSFISISRYADVCWGATGWPFIVAALLPPAGLLLRLRLLRRLRALRLFRTIIAAMFGIAGLFFMVVASSRWVAMNGFHLRYFVPGYLLLISVGGLSLWLIVRLAPLDRTIRGAAFVGLATVMLLTAMHRLQPFGGPGEDIIGNDRSEIARAVAARYVGRSLDGIAGDYWDVWPAVFVTEQYHYDNGYVGPNVLGIADRGGVRRFDFAARIAAQGRLRIVCIDFLPTDCAIRTSVEMGMPGLRFSELAPVERIPGDHRLWFIEVTPADTPK
jgi:hypothetical protein